MRFTKIIFHDGTMQLQLNYETPNANGDGWISHEHKGKFEPGDEFRRAFQLLDAICARTHELIVTPGEFHPEELAPFSVEPHPISARTLTLTYKAKSLLVKATISGVRTIGYGPGSFSLPGITCFKHPGDDDEHGDLFLTPHETQCVSNVEVLAKSILPRFIEALEIGDQQHLQLNGTTEGDGEVVGRIEPVSDFFDEETKQKAEQMAAAITDYQGRILLAIGGIVESDVENPEADSYKRNEKRAVTQLINAKLVIVTDGRLSPSSSGWDVITVLRQREAAEASS